MMKELQQDLIETIKREYKEIEELEKHMQRWQLITIKIEKRKKSNIEKFKTLII